MPARDATGLGKGCLRELDSECVLQRMGGRWMSTRGMQCFVALCGCRRHFLRWEDRVGGRLRASLSSLWDLLLQDAARPACGRDKVLGPRESAELGCRLEGMCV